MHIEDIDVVDVESLVQLKQTRRLRDYSIVGALAEVAGLQENAPELALGYLQDYALLARAVHLWPSEAASCNREAVQFLLKNAPRGEVVAALAIEQDARMQEDQRRIDAMQIQIGDYARAFARLRAGWRNIGVPLEEQHCQLAARAHDLLEVES